MSGIAYAVVALVALQRLAELLYAQRNTKALLARGAVEVGKRHYPLIVLLHLAWLIAIVLALPPQPSIEWGWIVVFGFLQLVRIWIIWSLGPYWTTRIITLGNAPLVRRGPYRFVRHPNYIVVALEIASLPLAFGEYWVAVAFSLANVGLLTWRIREENLALAPRRIFEEASGGAANG